MKPGNVWLERTMINSNAFRTLGATAHLVLLDFMCKRKMLKQGSKRNGSYWKITNNGEIVYTYDEAERKGISRPAFARALSQLTEKGFLDITSPGVGYRKVHSLYGMSDRWKKWGTPKFIENPRTPRKPFSSEYGFKPGHKYFPPKNKPK